MTLLFAGTEPGLKAAESLGGFDGPDRALFLLPYVLIETNSPEACSHGLSAQDALLCYDSHAGKDFLVNPAGFECPCGSTAHAEFEMLLRCSLVSLLVLV